MQRLITLLISLLVASAAMAASEGYFGAQLGLPEEGDGVVILTVLPGSPAVKAGFKPADPKFSSGLSTRWHRNCGRLAWVTTPRCCTPGV